MAQPAVLIESNAVVRQELRDAVIALTGFSSVQLSEHDLTQNSELVIERWPHKDGRGELIQGRNLELPQRLKLVLQDGACWLVHPSNGRRLHLAKATCRPDTK
jgi:hypothetical protein